MRPSLVNPRRPGGGRLYAPDHPGLTVLDPGPEVLLQRVPTSWYRPAMHSFNDDLTEVEIRWLDRASDSLSYSGTPAAAVIHAVRYPDHVTVDPSSRLLANEGRWYAERRRKGDLTVVVGFPPGETPCIWGVYHNLPMPLQRLPKASTSGGGTTVPTSTRELRRRIIDAGLVIKSGGRHDRVETPDGQFVFSLSISPSDHRSIQNAVRQLARKGYDVTR